MQNSNYQTQDWMGALGEDDLLEAHLDGGTSYSKISTAGKAFTLKFAADKDGQKRPAVTVGMELNVVILGMTPDTTRAYYEGIYDPINNYIPKCASNNGIAPVARSSHPQSLLCANCPKAARGSAHNQQGIAVSACRVGRNAVVAINGDMNELFQLKINGQGLTPLKKYLLELAQYNIKYPFVNTRLTFQLLGKNNQVLSFPILNFTRGEMVTREVGMAGIAHIQSPLIREMLGLEDKVVTSLIPQQPSAFNAPGPVADDTSFDYGYTEESHAPAPQAPAPQAPAPQAPAPQAPAPQAPAPQQYAPPPAAAPAAPVTPTTPKRAARKPAAAAPVVNPVDIDSALAKFDQMDPADFDNIDID